MQLSTQSLSSIEKTIKKMANKCTLDEEQARVTDLHFQPCQETGELVIFDDDDTELARTFVQEWTDYKEDDFYSEVEKILHNLLERLQKEGVFDKLSIWKPYSMVMVDEEKETIVDLLLFDDDTVIINEQLLKGLDEEMDSFLNHLLEDE